MWRCSRAVLLAWLLLLGVYLPCANATTQLPAPARLSAEQLAAWRREVVGQFLDERRDMEPLCLYTFDGALDDVVQSLDVVDAQVARVRGQLPGRCPFGDLHADPALVTSLNTNESFFQLGVHVDEDPGKDPLRVQMASAEVVSARDFFVQHATTTDTAYNSNGLVQLVATLISLGNKTVRSNGVGFEMVIRRRAQQNQTMSLFAILNDLDACADAGFRLDVSASQVLTFTYNLPASTTEESKCLMHRFASRVPDEPPCTLPPVEDPIENTPPVYIMFTLNPSEEFNKWVGVFYLSYINATTQQRVDCKIKDVLGLPENTLLAAQEIEGSYRLYLGNHPRNLSSPRERLYSPKAREYRQFGGEWANQNATTRLREALRTKLMQIRGPEMPKAMRVIKSGSYAFNILGFTFPPVNEDTPFAMIREKIEEVKATRGDAIIDHLMETLRKTVSKDEDKGTNTTVSQTPGLTSPLDFREMARNKSDQELAARTKLALTNGEGATFDLFHFAIYDNVPTDKRFRRLLWNNSAQPFRASPFHHFPAPVYKQVIEEDETKLLSLTQLHSVFNDVRLELLSLPAEGKLFLYPNKSLLRKENMAAFSRMPLEYQRLVYYAPDSGDNSGTRWQGSFKTDPYGTIRYRIMDSIVDRNVSSKLRNASLNVFVNDKNDPPRPRTSVLNISVNFNVPVSLVLDGDDPDGPKLPDDPLSEKVLDSDDPTLFDKAMAKTMDMLLGQPPPPQPQVVQISQFPRFGTLFDVSLCNWQAAYMIADATVLQDCQIESSTSAVFPTRLVYVYRGWGRQTSTTRDVQPLRNNSDGSPLDSMQYRISDGDKTVFSEVVTINFFATSQRNRTAEALSSTSMELNTAKVVNMSEDSFAVITLAEVEPLGGALSPQTRYQVTALPAHGSLFQYLDLKLLGPDAQNVSNVFLLQGAFAVGDRLASSRVLVTDPLGRLIYVPERNYFNTEASTPYGAEELPLDFFEYKLIGFSQAVNSSLKQQAGFTAHDESAAQLANPRYPRVVKMRVVNEPDPIVILPPYVTKAAMGRGESVPVPLSFEDPDGSFEGGHYEVTLEADGKGLEFQLPQQISENYAMALCDYERPCFIQRDIGGLEPHAKNDSSLTYILRDILPVNSKVRVSGTFRAVRHALSTLVVRDTDRFVWDKSHTSLFTFTVERANTSESRRSSETIRVVFAAHKATPKVRGIIAHLAARITQWLWTGGFVSLFVIVSQNLPCCATGFCCCFRAKARRKQRKRFEQKRREFQDRVAQNDYEYSLLIVELADVILQPDLLVAISLVRSVEFGRAPTRCRLEQVLCLNSLLPVLESERQGTRFVFGLILLEFQKASEEVGFTVQAFDERSFLEYPNVASLALSLFCRMVGSRWLADTLEQVPTASETVRAVDPLEVADEVLDQLAAHVADLPVEIVILCRTVTKLLASAENADSRTKSQRQLAATHLVFFNHFLGPALRLAEETRLSSHATGLDDGREQALVALALALSRLPDRWHTHRRTRDTELTIRMTTMIESSDAAASCSSSSSDSLSRVTEDRDLGSSPPIDQIEAIARHCRLRYEALLHMIAVSDDVQSSYEPPTTGSADNELMALCLMNVHAYLDTHLGVFLEQFRVFVSRRLFASGLAPSVVESLTEEDIQSTEARVVRVMRALGFPMMSMHALVEHCKGEILSDTLVWSGWSLREWSERSDGQIRGVGEGLGTRQGRRHAQRDLDNGRNEHHEGDHSDAREIPHRRGRWLLGAPRAHSLDSVRVENEDRQDEQHREHRDAGGETPEHRIAYL